MSQRGTTIVRGHALRDEGAPYDEHGRPRQTADGGVQHGGTGHALCECGQLSPLLASDRERKSWHRGHKAEIRDAVAV